MTGIERLRGVAGFWRENKLDDIVEQIEREQGGRVSRMRVLSVVTDMERNVLGHEGADDSPVARWARELREALDGEKHDPAKDVSMSAYDLLPQDERDAIAWVCEHGGLEEVKRLARYEVKEEVELAAFKKLRFLAGVREGETSSIADMVESIAARLMPEGMEWPRFEDGELVHVGDSAPFGTDDVMEVVGVEINRFGYVLHGSINDGIRECVDGDEYGVAVKRPAPKVLDADGVEIREKRDVWWICEGDERGLHAERLRVETILPDGLVECSPYNGGTWVSLEPSELYVNKPVPASDGRPLREGETVWNKQTGRSATVKGFDRMLDEPCAVIDFAGIEQRVRGALLTHERPDSKCRDCAHWQKDPTADNMGVCWFFYHEHEGQDCYAARRADIGACEEFMPRGKALAGDA